jgi:uncharacterized protein YbcI
MTNAVLADVSKGRSVQLAVSNQMVRIYKTHFGRGPTKARADFAGPDVLVATLQDSFTPVERNMVALGAHLRLRELRMFFQRAAATEFREEVERLTGRKVWAFVSGTDTDQDVSTEIFYLEPPTGEV